MADIRYTPVTNGQTFGDAGRLFESATRSLNRATQGASTAFNTFRQGSIDARDQRTQDAIASIQGARTVEEYNALAAGLQSPEQFSQSFGDIDVNKATAALRAQQGIAQNNFIQDAAFEKTRVAQHDDPLLNAFRAQNAGKSSTELDQLDISNLGLGLDNRISGQDAFRSLREGAIAREGLERTRANEALGRRDTDTLQNLEGRLRGLPSEDLRGLTADSFDLQLQDQGAPVNLLNSILAERQATTTRNQQFDQGQKLITDTAATQGYIEQQNLAGTAMTRASVNSWAKANNIDPNTANRLVNQFNLNTGATEAAAATRANEARLQRIGDTIAAEDRRATNAATVATTKNTRKIENDAKNFNDEFSLSVSSSDDGLFNVSTTSSVAVTETLSALREAGLSEEVIKIALISGNDNGFLTGKTFSKSKAAAAIRELRLKGDIDVSKDKLNTALGKIDSIGKKAPLKRDANNAAILQGFQDLLNP